MGDVVIKAEHLSKMYRLGTINNGTLWKDLQTWMALKLGKDDPHSRIGEDKYSGDEDHFWALKDINFEIKQGERVGIIGKNGAGKSTLLKILSRVTAPTEGIVKVKGKVASLLEVGTGFNGELTGRENIYLNGAILGMKKRQIDKKLDEIIDFSGIEHHIDTPVKRYSSGMYVRLAFAVAAHLDSEILIADEVLAVGDAAFQKKALGKMQDLSAGQGRTILFVSHNMAAVTSLCRRGIVVSSGRIILDDYLDTCIEEYLKTSSSPIGGGAWTGDEGDENLRISAVTLSNSNDPEHFKANYLRSDRIILRIEYELLAINPDYVFSIEIVNSHGVVLCVSSATEYFSTTTNIINQLGKHKLQLIIDSSIIAPGDYTIKFDFAIRNVKRIIDDFPNLAFTIESRESFDSVLIPKQSNIIAPMWEWKVM